MSKTSEAIKSGKSWLDFSSLSLFMKCPKSYFWRVDRDISTLSTAALVNGSAYHEAISTYHTIKTVPEPERIQLSIAVGIDYMLKHLKVEDESRNPTVLTETLSQYFKLWKNEIYKTVSAETGFSLDIDPILFVGKIDRTVIGPAGKYIIETKTTSIVGTRWASRLKPNLQITGYLAADYILSNELASGAVLDVIPIHADSKKRQKPFRYITARTIEELDSWVITIQEWWKIISRCKDDNYFPQNTEACMPLIGFSCYYTRLCNRYVNPEKMNTEDYDLGTEFTVDKWEPYAIKESAKE